MAERDPQQLLAAYRSGLGPPRGAEERMLASLRSQIAAPQSGGTGTGSGGAGAGGATATAKLAAVALAATIGVAAVVVAVIGRDAPPVEPASVVMEVEVGPSVREIEPPPTIPSAVNEVAALVELEAQTQSELSEPRTPSRRRARTEEPKPAPSLADEAKLLRSVDVALRRGDLATARMQLDAYRDSFAAGSLRAQSEELALLLACAEGTPGASEYARDHLAAHPDSRARNRIEDTCDVR
jgi:hypothetical protein